MNATILQSGKRMQERTVYGTNHTMSDEEIITNSSIIELKKNVKFKHKDPETRMTPVFVKTLMTQAERIFQEAGNTKNEYILMNDEHIKTHDEDYLKYFFKKYKGCLIANTNSLYSSIKNDKGVLIGVIVKKNNK